MVKNKKNQLLKMSNSYLIILLASTLLLCTQCKKGKNIDADGLPKATRIGAMVFACKINGQNWIASYKNYNISGAIKGDTISFRGTVAETIETFQILILKKNDQMTYKLSDSNNQYAQYISDKDCSNSKLINGWSEKKATEGELTFTTIDKERKVISGTFWFNVPTDKCGLLKITDGRFDIRYNN